MCQKILHFSVKVSTTIAFTIIELNKFLKIRLKRKRNIWNLSLPGFSKTHLFIDEHNLIKLILAYILCIYAVTSRCTWKKTLKGKFPFIILAFSTIFRLVCGYTGLIKQPTGCRLSNYVNYSCNNFHIRIDHPVSKSVSIFSIERQLSSIRERRSIFRTAMEFRSSSWTTFFILYAKVTRLHSLPPLAIIYVTRRRCALIRVPLLIIQLRFELICANDPRKFKEIISLGLQLLNSDSTEENLYIFRRFP